MLGDYLLRCLKEGYIHHAKQKLVCKEYTSTWPAATVHQWKKDLQQWYTDPSSDPDPFEEPESGESFY